MATYSKPASIPRWADTGTIVEPPEGLKDSGHLFQVIPSSSFENWKENLNGDWWKWIDERVADGPTPDVIALLDASLTNADPIVEFDGLTALESNLIFRDGATNSTLKVTKDTQILQWLNGAVQAFSADDTKFVVGPSDADGIRMFGAGDLKGITFDENLNQLRYRISTDTFSFMCNSGSSSLDVNETRVHANRPLIVGATGILGAGGASIAGGLRVGNGAAIPTAGQAIFLQTLNVGSDAVPTAGVSKFLAQGMNIGAPANDAAVGSLHAATGLRVGDGASVPNEVGSAIFAKGIMVGSDIVPTPDNTFGSTQVQVFDANFGMFWDGFDNARLQFDAGDYIDYDRSANEMDLRVGNGLRLKVTTTQMRPANNGGFDLGSSGLPFGSVRAHEFVPSGGFDATPDISRFEYSLNNCITARAKGSSGGTLRTQHWSVTSLTRIGTGQYIYVLDTNLISDGMIIPNTERFLSPVYVACGEWDFAAGEVQIRVMDTGAVLRDFEHGFMAWG